MTTGEQNFGKEPSVDLQQRKRYISLQTSITVGMIVLGISISAIISGIFYLHFKAQVREDIRLRLKDITEITALQLDPEELSTVDDRADVENPVYVENQKRLSDIINASSDVLNIYTMRRSGAGVIYFYMDAGRPDYKPDPPGVAPYQEPSDLLLATFDSPSGTAVENDIYTDEFGSVISAYTPLYRRDGNLESILAVDLKADVVLQAEQEVLQSIFVYFGVSVPFVFLIAWLLGYRLSRRTATLTLVISRIAGMADEKLEAIPYSLAGNNREAFNLVQAFNRFFNELQSRIHNLEQRIAERTRDIETAAENSARRTRQIEAIAQINRAITSIEDLEVLLPRIVQAVSEKLDVYHTGIFLLDGNREFAILCAANSLGGKKMLERGHKIQVGQAGTVGFVAATGQPRIALDDGSDPVRFDNPDLPNTRSEITLPLRHNQRVIGVLDVQSARRGDFTQTDMEVLVILADQISFAINTTLTLEDAKKSIAESQGSFAKAIQETWKVMRPASLGTGFQLINSTLLPLDERLEGEHVQEAMAKGAPAILNREGAPSSMAIPISLRGQVIGIISLTARNQRRLTADDADIARAVTERLSLAIETATLLQSTQHRADVERVTTEITSKISSSTQFETILQTAAQELSKALGGSDVLVQIEPASMEMGMSS
jgi:GAF domain-containing protein